MMCHIIAADDTSSPQESRPEVLELFMESGRATRINKENKRNRQQIRKNIKGLA